MPIFASSEMIFSTILSLVIVRVTSTTIVSNFSLLIVSVTIFVYVASLTIVVSLAHGTAASPLSAVLGLWPTISFTSGSLAISHGIFYIGTDIANLTLSLNTVSGAQYHLKFTTSSTIGTFDFSAVTSWIGNSPSISASTTYEIDILDGVGIIATVG